MLPVFSPTSPPTMRKTPGPTPATAPEAFDRLTAPSFWPINPQISSDLVYTFQLDLMRAIWVMLPGAVLWGASFPLALAAVAKPGQDTGRLVGSVYAANTVGAIILFFAGLARVGPSVASILSLLEAPVTVGLAAAIFAESLSTGQLLGGALVLGAVLVVPWTWPGVAQDRFGGLVADGGPRAFVSRSQQRHERRVGDLAHAGPAVREGAHRVCGPVDH